MIYKELRIEIIQNLFTLRKGRKTEKNVIDVFSNLYETV